MESLTQDWFTRDVVAILCIVHNLPKHPKRLLPKYELDMSWKLE